MTVSNSSTGAAPSISVAGDSSKTRAVHPWAVKRIWGGMEGPIWVLVGSWHDNRYLEIGKNCPDVDEAVVTRVARSLLAEGRYMVKGDVFARDYAQWVLTTLYDPEQIHFLDVGKKDKESVKDKWEEIKGCNLIVLCGPLGNPYSPDILEKAHLGWLFPRSGDPDPHRIRKHPQRDEWLVPQTENNEATPDTLQIDYGVFFKVRNPFAAAEGGTKWVIGGMGAFAWGTQIAIAGACCGGSAREILAAQQSQRISEIKEIRTKEGEILAWLRCWSANEENEIERLEDFEECKFSVCWPLAPEGKTYGVYKNYVDVLSSHSYLKRVTARIIDGARLNSIVRFYGRILAGAILIVGGMLLMHSIPVVGGVLAVGGVCVGIIAFLFPYLSQGRR
jgi:hypothetical protein